MKIRFRELLAAGCRKTHGISRFHGIDHLAAIGFRHFNVNRIGNDRYKIFSQHPGAVGQARVVADVAHAAVVFFPLGDEVIGQQGTFLNSYHAVVAQAFRGFEQFAVQHMAEQQGGGGPEAFCKFLLYDFNLASGYAGQSPEQAKVALPVHAFLGGIRRHVRSCGGAGHRGAGQPGGHAGGGWGGTGAGSPAGGVRVLTNFLAVTSLLAHHRLVFCGHDVVELHLDSVQIGVEARDVAGFRLVVDVGVGKEGLVPSLFQFHGDRIGFPVLSRIGNAGCLASQRKITIIVRADFDFIRACGFNFDVAVPKGGFFGSGSFHIQMGLVAFQLAFPFVQGKFRFK